MSGVQPSHHLGLRRVLTAALLVGALVLGGAMGLFAYASRTVDRVQQDNEIALAGLRLERMQEKTLEDVQSSAVWNDAAAGFGRADLEWIQENFGDYYADYMGHDVTLAFNSDGRMILASRESEPVAAAVEAQLTEVALPLVRELQAERPEGFGFDAARQRTVVKRVGDATYLLAVSTVVPEDASVTRADRDPVVVSARNITAVVDSLASDLALKDPVFLAEGRTGQAVLPVTDSAGLTLGVLAWTPDRPGARVLAQAAPLFVALIAALIGAAGVLWMLLDRIARQMERARADLAEARDRAEAANEAKTRFLANISHELRTPLNGVLGMAEIMGHGELSPIQRGHLSILKASGDDLLRMIEDILLVTRIERAEVSIEMAPFDLDALLFDLAGDTRNAVADRAVSVGVDAGTPGLWSGDVDHVRQALQCLLTNAADFTRSGEIRLGSMVQDESVQLTVADTAPGIDPAFLPRLFDDFAQADESITRVHEGAGLGLAICRRLVVAMGGSISVQSALEKGSTFTINLPLSRAEPVRTDMAA
ncbi:MAG: ATP-binding protein [Brevundimonas sp.]|uniref:ATP-binding protein n=1 Tax=Brevundimonas sp. TaxID=1871086 RepID=UPI002ABB4AB9|nr:ATP-binding protein [Brevundimonas sp.]MDZ4109212.1 ATP-binding protein [Brevundimonas sp.]